MNCLVRAAKYLHRKKRKTIPLFLLFLVICVMISGTLSIRASSQRLTEELRRNAEGRVMLESLKPQDGFNGLDLQEIAEVKNVNWINRISEIKCPSQLIFPVAGNMESEALFDVHGYDQLEKDSPFSEHVYRIIDGTFPQSQDEIVINQYLADANGIQTGDKITLQSVWQQPIEAVISGIFLSGEEERQTGNVATANRIENQIYATTDFVNALSGEDSFVNASIYVNDPGLLEETTGTLSAMYEGRAVAGAMDNTFQRLSQTIVQTERVTFLILLLTILVGFTAAGLLLAMWTRGRKKEIAVLVSLGVSKGDIFLQMLLEETFLYVLAFTASQAVTAWSLPFIGRNMDYLQDNDMPLHLSHGGMAAVLCAGLAGVMILTGISVFPYMRKQIKEILSEMEG